MDKHIEAKHDLLVFRKKEVIVILMILTLVSLVFFTVGLKMGRQLALQDKNQTPNSEKTILRPEKHNEKSHENISTEHGSAAKHNDSAAEKNHEEKSLENEHKSNVDESLSHELEKTNVKSGKVIPMSLPESKKSDSHAKINKVVKGKYTLQIGSHRTVQEAEDQVAEFKKAGLDAFYLEVVIPNKGTWYRVGVGMYPTKEMADKAADRYRKSGKLTSFIIQKVIE